MSNKPKKWKDIDWIKANEYVNRLQQRIVKATQQQNWNLVKRLQYLLTNSFYAKAIAIKRVCRNKGSRTPGVDGVVWRTEKDKWNALMNLKIKGYHARPTRRIHIQKSNGKLRPLSIPTMKDRAMQTLFLLALQPIEETIGDTNSYGFRMHRSCQDACEQIFIATAQKSCATWILEGDIKGCFDNISHDWILKNIPLNKRILSKFIKAGYIYKNRLFPTTRGAIQGGSISPTIANLVLDGLEKEIWNAVNKSKDGHIRKYNPLKVHFIRYADDFIVTAKDKETLLVIKGVIADFLSERGLQLSEEKTLCTHISQGFDFLGWTFRKFRQKLIIKPSKKSVKSILRKISDIIRNNKTATQEGLISKLNPVIRGWSNYHASVCSSYTFNILDHWVFKMLYNWALRRHHRKHIHRIINKYWHQVNNFRWCFTEGKSILARFGETPIVRHLKLKHNKNPYLDTDYFVNLIANRQARRRAARNRTSANGVNVAVL